MKSQEVSLYQEIQRNTEMAMKAIDTISDKIYDDALAMQMSRQYGRTASRQLVEAKAQNYQGSALADVVLKTGLRYNTMLNTSTGRIAELMIKNSTNGILEMEKALKHNEGAGERPVALAKQLIELEEKNVARLKSYL